MNEVSVFNNPAFGQVRSVVLSGEPWFIGKDVAEVLGYSNPNEAIQDHVDNEDKFLRSQRGSEMLKLFSSIKDIQEKLGRQDNWFINESGLYSLIFSSKLETAKAFKRWVTSEVLPEIRKTGYYQMPAPVQVFPAGSLAAAISDIGDTAAAIEKVFAVKHGMAMATASAMVEAKYGIDTKPLKYLMPPEQYPGYMNPTAIGRKLGGLRAVQVNKMLEQLGFQHKEGSSWRLDEAGREYGEEKPFTNHGHSGYTIAWNDLILKVLKLAIDEKYVS